MELKLPLTIEECHNYIKSQKELLEVLTACVNKQALKILELKELLTRNSQNSSKPPSQDNRKNKTPPKPPSNRPSGGQPGHKGSNRKLLDEKDVDKMVVCELRKTCSCGGNIKATEEYQAIKYTNYQKLN